HHDTYQPRDGYGRAQVAAGDPISSASAGRGSPAAQTFIPGIQLLPPGQLQRGHLLANVLGGPGNEVRNLTPLLVATNTAMKGPESRASKFIYEGPSTNSLYYEARASYRPVSACQTWLEGLFPGVPANGAH